VEEFTHLPQRPLVQKGIVEVVGAQDDGSNNNRNSTTFLVTWASVIEI
jgi:hypothetical protein